MIGYKIYTTGIFPRNFCGTFTHTETHKYTIPELRRMLEFKSLKVIGSAGDYMIAIGRR